MKRFIYILFLLTAVIKSHATEFYTPLTTEGFKAETISALDDTLIRLTFTDAIHINNIPWFNTDFPAQRSSKASDFIVELTNIKSAPCSSDESELLYGIGEEPIINKEIATTRGEKTLEIYVLPFFIKNGTAHRIESASLHISQASGGLKTGEALKTAQKYAANSVLAGGSWYKIAVETSGLYKLTYSDIKNMGIGDPAGVRVYGYGGALIDEDLSKALPRYDDLPEVAVYMEKGADGVFSEGDYILFYAQGVVKDNISKEEPTHSYTYNYCSKEGYYFITCGSGEGLRMEKAALVTNEPTVTFKNTLAGYYIHSDETTLLTSGREWYGYKFSSGTLSRTFTICDTNIDTGEDIYIDATLVAHSSNKTQFAVTFNGADAGTVNIAASTSSHIAGKKGLFQKYLNNNTSSNPRISLKYSPFSASDAGYLYYICANYYKRLILDSNNSSILITNPEELTRGVIAKYEITGASGSTMVWDITDPVRTKRIPATISGGTLTFKEERSEFHKYIAFNPNAAKAPKMVGAVGNQNLHQLSVADMVIITPPEYMNAANRLANFHRTNDNLSVHIITPELIYNEFSSGTPDVSAYRLLMKMFYDRAMESKGRLPQHLLLMGVTGYDNRGIKNEKRPLVGYQSPESLTSTSSYTTDDFYGMLDDNEGAYISSATMDISVGRLPVTSEQEAENVVTKTINYVTSSSTGDWRALCTFLGDNDDSHAHEQQADQLASMVTETNNSYRTDKIFLDSYIAVNSSAGTSYPGARNKVLQNLKDGTVVFTFVGHGSPNILTTEQTISKNDITGMYNKNLALWATATCDFSRYDDVSHSAGMEVILNPNGGGIALYTTTRVVYSSENFKLMKAAFTYLFPEANAEHKTIGEIFRLAKIDLKNNSNKLNFTLLGDPAIKIHYPSHIVKTDSINHSVPAEAEMQALGIVTIRGHLENANADTLKNFNGKILITVYDKEETLKTLGQVGDKSAFSYKDYPNKLFKGTISVTNGLFETTFMVPKDINYRIDKGKILYYAWQEGSTENDAFGNDVDFRVGGTDPSYEETTVGPVIRAYMNAPEFVNGGKVNSSPVFYSHTFDEYGVNVVGAGIGHDATVILTGPVSGTYNLNDSYVSALNDYKNGMFKYQFRDLEQGSYRLDFKVWNLQNISNTTSLEFVVDTLARPEIEEFFIYPNPASDHATMYLRHNRPEVPLSVTFRVYDMGWREYWSSTVTENTDGTYHSTWKMAGGFNNVCSGVYWVRAIIHTPNGNYTQLVKKLIVKTK
ncbi:MAG: type IX secretion system sortase PorU [Paludibacteraceae bacterium]|nr:type IX secretion system sortase PorU [Paludibacteraceae bacterium]